MKEPKKNFGTKITHNSIINVLHGKNQEQSWFLDNGCSQYMSGTNFTSLDL